MKKIIIVCTAIVAVFVASCKNDLLLDGDPSMKQEDFTPALEESSLEAIYRKDPGAEGLRPFAKALYGAMTESPALRKLIRDRALERFNKEWDVLYQFIKDELVENRLTVRQLLLRHIESEEKLAMIETQHPTLTIFVPKLPEDCFSAENWDTEEQIPVVAIHSTRQMHIPVFSQVGLLDARSDESVLKAGTVPGFPVVVVKDNKHVVVSENSRSKYESLNNPNSDYVFDFSSDCYDGSRKAENSLRSVCIRDSNMDQKLIDAYNRSVDIYGNIVHWQRDHIYYDLNYMLLVKEGKLCRNYFETVHSFRFSEQNTPDQVLWYLNNYSGIGDPTLIPGYISSNGNNPPYPWTGGNWSFKICVETGCINPSFQHLKMIEKIFIVDPDDLFEVSFIKDQIAGWPYSLYLYTPYLSGFKTKYVDIELFNWNLREIISETIKISIYKQNQSSTQTYTVSTSNTFATNVEYNTTSGDEVKTGLKFGNSQSTTVSGSYTITKQISDLHLGDVFVSFGDPVITGTHTLMFFHNTLFYDLLEYGNTYKISLLPQKMW